ncbi:MAG: hypothetical protein H0W62_12320 [Chitinophagales bacterium]|nr:hypothetical protein [Chitinophagales bacterium]
MSNHVHFIIAAPRANANLNVLVSNGKRFIAYGIVGRLKKSHRDGIIAELSGTVKPGDKKRGKLHQVFEPSFDARLIYNEKMLIQKIDYIHHNPVSGRWSLVRDFVFYPHSSAAFYELNKPCMFPVVHYSEILHGEQC